MEITGSLLSQTLLEKAKEGYFQESRQQNGNLELRNVAVLNPTLEKVRALFAEGPSPEFKKAISDGLSSHQALSYSDIEVIREDVKGLWGEHLLSYLSRLSQVRG